MIKTVCWTAAALFSLHGVAHAQTFDAVRLVFAAPGQDGGAYGAAVVASPEYPGADSGRVALYPALDYQWASGWFAGTTNGIGFNFSARPLQQYGVRATLDLGRPESRSSALAGMGDVEIRPEIGLFFNQLWPTGSAFTSSLRYGSGNARKGLVIELGAGTSWALSPALSLGAGVGATWANAEHNSAYFGVTATQAAASGHAPYSAGAGVRDVRAGASLTYRFNPQTSLTGVLGASLLQGDARSSPLVRDKTGVSGVLVLARAF